MLEVLDDEQSDEVLFGGSSAAPILFRIRLTSRSDGWNGPANHDGAARASHATETEG